MLLLPKEILYHIFSFLEKKDLCSVLCVCKNFYSVTEPLLYKRISFHDFHNMGKYIYNLFDSSKYPINYECYKYTVLLFQKIRQYTDIFSSETFANMFFFHNFLKMINFLYDDESHKRLVLGVITFCAVKVLPEMMYIFFYFTTYVSKWSGFMEEAMDEIKRLRMTGFWMYYNLWHETLMTEKYALLQLFSKSLYSCEVIKCIDGDLIFGTLWKHRNGIQKQQGNVTQQSMDVYLCKDQKKRFQIRYDDNQDSFRNEKIHSYFNYMMNSFLCPQKVCSPIKVPVDIEAPMYDELILKNKEKIYRETFQPIQQSQKNIMEEIQKDPLLNIQQEWTNPSFTLIDILCSEGCLLILVYLYQREHSSELSFTKIPSAMDDSFTKLLSLYHSSIKASPLLSFHILRLFLTVMLLGDVYTFNLLIEYFQPQTSFIELLFNRTTQLMSELHIIKQFLYSPRDFRYWFLKYIGFDPHYFGYNKPVHNYFSDIFNPLETNINFKFYFNTLSTDLCKTLTKENMNEKWLEMITIMLKKIKVQDAEYFDRNFNYNKFADFHTRKCMMKTYQEAIRFAFETTMCMNNNITVNVKFHTDCFPIVIYSIPRLTKEMDSHLILWKVLTQKKIEFKQADVHNYCGNAYLVWNFYTTFLNTTCQATVEILISYASKTSRSSRILCKRSFRNFSLILNIHYLVS